MIGVLGYFSLVIIRFGKRNALLDWCRERTIVLFFVPIRRETVSFSHLQHFGSPVTSHDVALVASTFRKQGLRNVPNGRDESGDIDKDKTVHQLNVVFCHESGDRWETSSEQSDGSLVHFESSQVHNVDYGALLIRLLLQFHYSFQHALQIMYTCSQNLIRGIRVQHSPVVVGPGLFDVDDGVRNEARFTCQAGLQWNRVPRIDSNLVSFRNAWVRENFNSLRTSGLPSSGGGPGGLGASRPAYPDSNRICGTTNDWSAWVWLCLVCNHVPWANGANWNQYHSRVWAGREWNAIKLGNITHMLLDGFSEFIDRLPIGFRDGHFQKAEPLADEKQMEINSKREFSLLFNFWHVWSARKCWKSSDRDSERRMRSDLGQFGRNAWMFDTDRRMNAWLTDPWLVSWMVIEGFRNEFECRSFDLLILCETLQQTMSNHSSGISIWVITFHCEILRANSVSSLSTVLKMKHASIKASVIVIHSCRHAVLSPCLPRFSSPSRTVRRSYMSQWSDWHQQAFRTVPKHRRIDTVPEKLQLCYWCMFLMYWTHSECVVLVPNPQWFCREVRFANQHRREFWRFHHYPWFSVNSLWVSLFNPIGEIKAIHVTESPSFANIIKSDKFFRFSAGQSLFYAPANNSRLWITTKTDTASFFVSWVFVDITTYKRNVNRIGSIMKLDLTPLNYYTFSSIYGAVTYHASNVNRGFDINLSTIFVYDGDDLSAPFIGNLMNLITANGFAKSTGKSLTLVNLYAYTTNSYGISNDYRAIKDYTNYSFLILSADKKFLVTGNSSPSSKSATTFYSIDSSEAYITSILIVDKSINEQTAAFQPLTPSHYQTAVLTYE